ncbi:macrolide ABC transporter ATP-binding protein [Geobacillus sp. T6]|uniref:ABC transporter ATP-binding protein n=1 Tax=Geobacillus TaxID=129337 RepID=UPI0001D58203|nr:MULTISPECIES: ABC transporter ATP-binding protein [unclassified Geobacillus]ADI25415.1 ABC transporter related protein [Geobacillus sp. C56-T3]KLR72287.1 macrolide ABC transporter ATP-binding protein [Geobacillus sp. T6]
MIELKNIEKSYYLGDEPIPILKKINLKISKGEFVSIMGPSGSGKSTLMNIIGCLDKPTSGDYIFEGQNVTNFTDKELARIRNRRIGFVFQQFHLLPRLTALKNVELPMIYSGHKSSTFREECAKNELKRMNLEERMFHLPNELSGGQKQRVAIARALINKPSLLLADEPTGALDTSTSYEIMDIFKQLNKEGTTIIIVTHDEDIANFADRKIILKDGHIISDTKVGK